MKNIYFTSHYPGASDLKKMDIATEVSSTVLENVDNPMFSSDNTSVIYVDRADIKPTSIWAADVSHLINRDLP